MIKISAALRKKYPLPKGYRLLRPKEMVGVGLLFLHHDRRCPPKCAVRGWKPAYPEMCTMEESNYFFPYSYFAKKIAHKAKK